MDYREGSPRSYACGHYVRLNYLSNDGWSKKPPLQTVRLSGGGFTTEEVVEKAKKFNDKWINSFGEEWMLETLLVGNIECIEGVEHKRLSEKILSIV